MATDPTDRVQEKAGHAAAQAQEAAGQAASQAQAKLREQIDQRSAQAAEQISTQASDLRSVSEALRQEGKHGPADAADRLAGYAERVGGYLRDKDADALLAEAEQFGRERPWAAAAGGLALGFAASRLLKASSIRRSQSRSTNSGTAGPSANGRQAALDAVDGPTRDDPPELRFSETVGYATPPRPDERARPGSTGQV